MHDWNIESIDQNEDVPGEEQNPKHFIDKQNEIYRLVNFTNNSSFYL